MGRWAVVAVDMDGTLVRGTTACLHLGETIGHGPVIADLERRYVRGEIDNAAVAEGDAVHYTGLTTSSLVDALATIPCIDGIGAGVELLVDRGIVPVIATVSWSFAAQCLADRYGFVASMDVSRDVWQRTSSASTRSASCRPSAIGWG